jgi:hypothetical protein
MPKTGMRQTFDLTTRNAYTKCDCEVGLTVEGKELPTMAVLGAALEEAIELIQKKVTESYKVVPERVGI